jgi:hypothetical protein
VRTFRRQVVDAAAGNGARNPVQQGTEVAVQTQLSSSSVNRFRTRAT